MTTKKQQSDSLAFRLKHARTQAGLTQKDLAKAVGLSQQTIQHLEAGRNRRSASLVVIARRLNISAEWLANGTGDIEAEADAEYHNDTQALNSQSIGERVRQRRLELNLTQQQLAQQAKVSRQTIQHLETGRNKNTANLIDLANALQVTASWLQFGDDADAKRRQGSQRQRGLAKRLISCSNCQQLQTHSNHFCISCGSELLRNCPTCNHEASMSDQFCGRCGDPLLQQKQGHYSLLIANTNGSALAKHIIHSSIQRFGGEPLVDEQHPSQIQGRFYHPRRIEHIKRACYAAVLMRNLIKHDCPDSEMVVSIDVPGFQESDAELQQRLLNHFKLKREHCIWIGRAAREQTKDFFQCEDFTGSDGFAPLLKPLDESKSLTKFLGRDLEFANIENIINKGRLGKTQLLAIAGNAGQGKSRLLYEFLGALDNNTLVLQGFASQSEQNTPLSVCRDFLMRWIDIDGSLPNREKISLLQQHIAQLEPRLLSQLEPLQELLGLPGDGDWSQQFDNTQKRIMMRDAFTDLIEAACKKQDVIIAFEDLQWFDVESEQIIHHLINNCRSAAAIIVTFRPEYQHHWWQFRNFTFMYLSPLDQDASGELLGDIDGDIKHSIVNAANGTPLLLEELLHQIDTENNIFPPLSANFESIDKLLLERINNLPHSAKYLLQCASLFGRSVPLEHIEQLCNLDLTELEDALQTLAYHDLLFEVETYNVKHLVFKHDITAIAAYNSFDDEPSLCAAHRKALQCLETLYNENLNDHLSALANHASKAKSWQKAAQYHGKAFLKSCQHSANNEAKFHFDQAISALSELERSPQLIQEEIRLRLNASTAMVPLGFHRELVDNLNYALNLEKQSNNPEQACQLHCQLTNAYWLKGEQSKALIHAENALRLASTPYLEIAANYNYGMAQHAMAEYEDSAAHHSAAIALIDDLQLQKNRMHWAGFPSVFARTFLGDCLIELGQFNNALEVIEAGREIAESSQHPYSQAMINHCYAKLLLYQEKYLEAEAILEDTLIIAERWEVFTMLTPLFAYWSQALLANGKLEAACSAVERSLLTENISRAGSYAPHYAQIAACTVFIATKQYPQAIELASDVIKRATNHQEFGFAAHAHLQLAKARAANGENDLALRHKSKAEYLAQLSKMRALLTNIERSFA